MPKGSYSETRLKSLFTLQSQVFLLPSEILSFGRRYSQIKTINSEIYFRHDETERARQKSSKTCFVLSNCQQSRQKPSPTGLAEHTQTHHHYVVLDTRSRILLELNCCGSSISFGLQEANKTAIKILDNICKKSL